MKNAKAGGGTSEIFLDLARSASTIVMRIVSHDGKRQGTNGEYDLVTAHVLVLDGPHQDEFHRALQITGKGITIVLTGEDVGDDICATLGVLRNAGRDYAAASPVTEEKFAAIEKMFADGDPFVAHLSTVAASGPKKPPWAK